MGNIILNSFHFNYLNNWHDYYLVVLLSTSYGGSGTSVTFTLSPSRELMKSETNLFRPSIWGFTISYNNIKRTVDKVKRQKTYLLISSYELLWEVSSRSESAAVLAWRTKNSTLGLGSFRERSPVGSRFSESLFRDVPGTVLEQVCTCGFRRNSSSFDKAPKIRDSVRLNSWASFLVNLPSISSDTWVMYSSVIPRTNVFCDWPFLALFCVSLETAANFRLFHTVAIMWNGEKLNSFEDWIWVFYFLKSKIF